MGSHDEVAGTNDLRVPAPRSSSSFGVFSGIGAIWLYAAVRPRFGPGIRTAALTGFAFWGLTTVLCALDETGVGLYPARLQITFAIVCLVQSIVASIAGAWLYKEYPLLVKSPDSRVVLKAAGELFFQHE